MASEDSASPTPPVWLQLADLSDRVAACEAQVGTSRRANEVPLQQRVAALTQRVDDMFKQDRRLLEAERGLGSLDGWLKAEHASASNVLLHRSTKGHYVVQHSEQLQEFARSLREVEALQGYINPPSLRELPAHGQRLQRLEATSTVSVGRAMQLHEQVNGLAQEYHQTITSLNDQLLLWNKLLSEKIAGKPSVSSSTS
eukprot:TRINITY_DN108698_c0_g1_i1.p1 TRINITY_DN108698_c0_g1~~TRINITY_DN108698_c0_g1_i1.p1  ORF type:complete len:199 (+),score=49.22 TRINITY_DN108698_c0_g1_i1:83-679(+)